MNEPSNFQVRVARAGERRVLTLGACRLAFVDGPPSATSGTTLEVRLPPSFDEWPTRAFLVTCVTYFVLEGDVRFTTPERDLTLGSEASFVVPARLPHRVSNPSSDAARLLLIAPSSIVGAYFEKLANLRARSRAWPPEDGRAWQALCRSCRVLEDGPLLGKGPP
ncbi:cupin domain-containing protein [Deinococcus yavapaiensis]|uniref:Cupin type-2 domain-containing protein n=1 Tax=Deinococcus yavapaiensis KR-236 TaxID=694435 RepID=A0A318S2F6_9DEIO|nr:cupin domain-containing protein [Deinococcus yavapaiensis]PYE52721.1 hypothetical protein DES52_11242 [Deinococcus yavapaiensis KR-236]